MTKAQSLVDYMSDNYSAIDTSTARRLIIEGRVAVNGAVIDDPEFWLDFDAGFVVEII
jgi:predicted rRNA methylase YqxC with S4 and FtsJ domains